MEEGGGGGGARSLAPGGPVLLVLCGLLEASGGARALPQLSDDIPFRVNWPGTEFSLPTTGVLYKEDNYVIMTTPHKEKYKCILPLVTGGDEEEEKDYKGPNPRELLEPLFKQSSCSYRIESYWTYEVCHGKHIRQYHEEKESGQEDLQSTKEERFPAVHKPIAVGSQPLLTVGTTHISKLTDDQLIKEFLSGSYCFQGGVGWWKYEFCYGKHVHQYHEDKESGKTSVVVGTWNQEEHIEWAKKNTARAYHLLDDGTQTVRMVSHFYGNGDICDITDKPRQVTVKLKCKESDSPHAVTVYMLEPHSCQYILGVESPVICKILDTADENGLLSLPN
uniref:Endoplasmic reticulum lectin n=1 Tax=Pipistrellus kuhlii TaxID=59472 RepID=A0A7J7VUI6_PIPKU|nr:endoplasmic reticulum lectin 1 [Pipistrellus kuhlii]